MPSLPAFGSTTRETMPDPRETTVIVQMNRPDWSVGCLRMLLAHSESPFHIVAVPGSRAFPDLTPHVHGTGSITFLRYEVGVDLLNKALAQVRTPFAVVMEDCMLATKGWLPRLLRPLLDHERTAASAPLSPKECGAGYKAIGCSSSEDLVRLGEYGKDPIGPEPFNLTDDLVRSDSPMQSGSTPDRQSAERHVDAPVFAGPCLALRASLLREIGGLDPELGDLSCRIADWCLRARQRGYALAQCRDVYLHALADLEADPPYLAHTSTKWEAFCRKWGMDAVDERLRAVAELPLATKPVMPAVPLDAASLAPPLATVVALFITAREKEAWVRPIANQTYPHTEWIVLADGAVDARLLSALRNRMDKAEPVIDMVVRDATRWPSALEAATRLARGRYIVYMLIGHDHAPDHVERIVDLLHRRSAPIAALVSPEAARGRIPLHATGHLRQEASGTIRYEVGSGECFYLLPDPEQPVAAERQPNEAMMRGNERLAGRDRLAVRDLHA